MSCGYPNETASVLMFAHCNPDFGLFKEEKGQVDIHFCYYINTVTNAVY